jgi:DDE superfamily endonuclease
LGGLTGRRRRLTAAGLRPVGAVHHVCAWCYVDGAVAPTTGERFVLGLPELHADTFQRLLEAFAHACPDRLPSLRLANRGAHTAPRLRWPEPLRGVWWPPYGPELHPMERVWRDREAEVAWEQFAELAAPLGDVGNWLQAYDAATLQSLAGYPSLVDAMNARCL